MDLTKDGIVFDAKPDAIPFNYRISYKVSLLCLIIKMCCGRRGCSLIKMHIVATAIADFEYKRRLDVKPQIITGELRILIQAKMPATVCGKRQDCTLFRVRPQIIVGLF